MRLLVWFSLISGLFAAFAISFCTADYVYVVKENDKFSKIIGKYIPGPVWGENGSYKKVLAQNSDIKNPEIILPGEKIILPDAKAPEQVPAASPEPSPTLTRTPIPAPTPIAEKVSPIKSDSTQTSLELAPFASMTSITSTDSASGAQAKIASGIYTGADARYFQNWNEDFKTYLRMRLAYVQFEAPDDNSKTISGASKLLTTFGVGARTKLSSRLSLGVSADLERDLFARSVTTSSVTVDGVLIPSVGGSLSLDLARFSAYTIGLTGVYEEKFSANAGSYTVDSGALYGGSIGIRQHTRWHADRACHACDDKFEIDLGAFNRAQNTSATTQAEMTYTLQLRFFFPFDKIEGEK